MYRKPVEIVLATDGVERLKRRFGSEPAIVSQLEALENDVQTTPDTHLDIRSVKHLIGTSAPITVSTLDAIAQSDVVITASSTFPRIVAQLCGTKTINGLTGQVIRNG